MYEGRSTLLTAPAPDLAQLSFALPEPESISEWISRLHMANVPEAAGQVRQATFEIARLNTDGATRMALLEGIRPTVLYLTARLDKAANDAGTSADAITRLAQRLQTNICSGYKAVVLAALADAESAEFRTTSLAIHRALSDLSRTLLRTLQYYVAPADKLWLNLHQLYLLAETLEIVEDRHADNGTAGSLELTIANVYLRSVLLALARPFQLRHRELAEIFTALGTWVDQVGLDQDSSETLYTVDLASDRGPGISAGFEESSTCRGIDLEALVTELESGLESEVASSREGLEPNLISHLTGAWGEVTSRAFNRADSSEPIRVCVGVESAHYHLSDEVPFDQTLKRDSDSGSAQSNPFGDNVYFLPNAGDFRDIRRGPSDAAGGRGANPKFESDGLPREDEYASFETTAADMSPSGYRLRWLEPFPPNLQTGELIGLRGESDPRWCLSVARWIRQGDEGPFMGVELLAPQARPVAIRVVQTKGGQMGFQPAFLLPDLKPLGRAASLITPPTPFKGGQKVHIRENGIQLTAQLGDCLLKTESFNQFTFRVLDGYLEKPGDRPNMRNQTNKNKHGSR